MTPLVDALGLTAVALNIGFLVGLVVIAAVDCGVVRR